MVNVELSEREFDLILGLLEFKMDYGGSPLIISECVNLYNKFLKISEEKIA